MSQTAIKKQSEERTALNGVDVAQLFENIEILRDSPGLARCVFRAKNNWIDGGHCRAAVKNFQAGDEEDISRSKPFVFDCDEPPRLLGANRGANPVEYLLVALSGCVTTSLVYYAAAKGIQLEEVESRLEGDIDLRGFLGIDESLPRGYTGIRIAYTIKADAPREVLEELLQLAKEHSPVHWSVTNAVPVTVSMAP